MVYPLAARDRELVGLTPASIRCCVLEQDILSILLSTGFYPEGLRIKLIKEGVTVYR